MKNAMKDKNDTMLTPKKTYCFFFSFFFRRTLLPSQWKWCYKDCPTEINEVCCSRPAFLTVLSPITFMLFSFCSGFCCCERMQTCLKKENTKKKKMTVKCRTVWHVNSYFWGFQEYRATPVSETAILSSSPQASILKALSSYLVFFLPLAVWFSVFETLRGVGLCSS